MNLFVTRSTCMVLALTGTLLSAPLRAGEQGARGATAGPTPAQYLQECGACHLAYPPQLLPPASWQRLMGSLDKHFGTDASLESSAIAQISGWLTANSAPGRQGTPPEDRITRSAWFAHEHREVAPPPGARKSYSNCAACHPGATQARFDEDEARRPQ